MFDAHDGIFVTTCLVQKAEGCLLTDHQNILLQQHTNALSHVQILIQRPIDLSGAMLRAR